MPTEIIHLLDNAQPSANQDYKNDDLKELRELNKLATLDLGQTQITDDGLKKLGGLKSLTVLNLFWTKVTDVGLQDIKGLKT